MRIYYVGSESSGKTTLARYTSEKYHLPLLPEAARAVLAEKELQLDVLRSNLDVVDNYQMEVFNRQLLEENIHHTFVSDRSIVDCLAYSCEHSRIFSKLLDAPELQHNIAALKQENTIIFFVRPSKATLKDDGVRERINWDHIITIDAQIKMLLSQFNIKYFQIDTSSMQERARIIDSVISLA